MFFFKSALLFLFFVLFIKKYDAEGNKKNAFKKVNFHKFLTNVGIRRNWGSHCNIY